MEAQDSPPYITNQEAARILFQVASLLEMMQCNPHRTRAYRRAALAVLFLPSPLMSYIEAGETPPLPGIGERIQEHLIELANTGRMGTYDTLLEEVGEPMLSLLGVHGIGPKTAIRLIAELKVESLDDIVEAARSGKIRELHGFGKKREAQLGAAAETATSVA